MPHLDASLIVAALTHEGRMSEVQGWLAMQVPERLVISDWVATEFSAVLSMKVRIQQLDVAIRGDVLAASTWLVRNTFTVLPLDRNDFREAARLADLHQSGLRAGDALHLAVVANRGELLLSLDKLQVQAAIAAGISARLF